MGVPIRIGPSIAGRRFREREGVQACAFELVAIVFDEPLQTCRRRRSYRELRQDASITLGRGRLAAVAKWLELVSEILNAREEPDVVPPYRSAELQARVPPRERPAGGELLLKIAGQR